MFLKDFIILFVFSLIVGHLWYRLRLHLSHLGGLQTQPHLLFLLDMPRLLVHQDNRQAPHLGNLIMIYNLKHIQKKSVTNSFKDILNGSVSTF